MLTLRCARQYRFLIYPRSTSAKTTAVLCSTSANPPPFPSPHLFSLPSNTNGALAERQPSDIGYFFREWFKSRKNPLYDSIFETLRTRDGSSADLSGFNLPLSESLVLDVLNYNHKEVLPCLKFFDWAGRQPDFYHTRATFSAIFRILSRAKLTDLMIDFLQNYAKHSYSGRTLYYNVLVTGYAMAGQCETALHVFGKMRFRGQDLYPAAYNVLLNSLVEKGHFEFVESLAREISVRGRPDSYTHSVMVRSLCMQNELERAEEYLVGLVKDGGTKVNGLAVSTLVTALCKDDQFERALLLIKEFKRMGLGMMEHAYSAWIGGLINGGKTDYALEFLKDKEAIDEYVPDVFRFNMLIGRLLRENRLEEVYDLLVDMNNRGLVPNDATMNAVLCFLCKAGMIDTAIDLFNSRAEFGLSVSRMAYNYLINTLLGEGSVEQSYDVLKKSLEQGYLPGERTLSLVANALCIEGKLHKVKELVTFMLNNNLIRSNFAYDKFVSALCRVNRVEEAYLLHNLITRVSNKSQKFAYYSLIHGFCRADRGDLAARLLIEMQDLGYRPSRRLFRAVICSICKRDNPRKQFFGLLEMQLSRSLLSHSLTFSIFLDGAGHAGKPQLAMLLYEIMKSSGYVPSFGHSFLLLQSYLKMGKVSHALDIFNDLSMKWKKGKLWNVMIVGLCRIKKPEYALMKLVNAQKAGITPSLQCYEELIKVYCDLGQHHNAIYLLNDMTRLGRHISSFIGNVFLFNALRNPALYDTWVSSSAENDLTSESWMLGHLIGIFSGCVEGDHSDEDIEALIQQCFQIDLYTYNTMLRRLALKGVNSARKLVHMLRVKGLEPNRWTYGIIIHGLVTHGREEEARMWMEEMRRKGFDFSRQPRRAFS